MQDGINLREPQMIKLVHVEKLQRHSYASVYLLHVKSWPVSACLHVCARVLLSIRSSVCPRSHMGQRPVSTHSRSSQWLPRCCPMIPLWGES